MPILIDPFSMDTPQDAESANTANVEKLSAALNSVLAIVPFCATREEFRDHLEFEQLRIAVANIVLELWRTRDRQKTLGILSNAVNDMRYFAYAQIAGLVQSGKKSHFPAGVGASEAMKHLHAGEPMDWVGSLDGLKRILAFRAGAEDVKVAALPRHRN